ncbi:capsular biosynthesis protein CpsC [Candidatus Saccharibacteria bacterium]|nr:capsular biosynthesis protein CpsC [Candidatus Saccharibacteria bacterium]MBQ3436736.1 capsular biosynthesis protein CpsC [Candidatus Saccharibacteria bacterium]MBR0415669.1 capsular biosynthesis protein CpsC [Candidatus Saccharibacteria bacterium]
MDEVNLKELFRYILSKFYIVVTATVVVVLAGEIYSTYLKTPLYRSTTKLVLTSSQGDNSQTAVTNTDVTLSNNLVKTYSEIVTSRGVLAKVIDNLKLDTTTDELANKVTVSSVSNTQIITIAVSDPDASQAEKIANEIAKVFKAEIVSLYKIDNVQIVDKAQVASSPYNVNILKQTLQFLAAGLAMGIGIVLIMFYLDNTVKNSQVVEDKVGLVVLGVVPKVGKKKRK